MCYAIALVIVWFALVQSFTIKSSYNNERLKARVALQESPRRVHTIESIECVEVAVNIPPFVNPIVVLEATAKAQEKLVDLALGDNQQLSVDLGTLDDIYGAVLWPASAALSRYMTLSGNVTIEAKTVLELGTGTGLCSIVACMLGAQHVIASDYEDLPMKMLKYSAEKLNNGGQSWPLEYLRFDVCNANQPLPECDVLLVADLLYEPRTAEGLANRVYEALCRSQPCTVLVADSPGRPGRPRFLQRLQVLIDNDVDSNIKTRYSISSKLEFIDIIGSTITGERHDLICGKTSTTISEKPQPLNIALLSISPSCI